MIECPSCGRKYIPGTLFCSECGVYLVTGGTLQTDPLPEVELPDKKASPWASESAEELGEKPPFPLRLKIAKTGRVVELPSAPEVHIGRIDVAHGIIPDLDLTPDAVPKDGVSRRHCKIHLRGSTYHLEDLGSANGTYLNGERLNPYLLHVLNDGDVIHLGRFELNVILRA
jgi:hypothetical protein